MQIYILRDNQQVGPFTEAEIQAQLAAGTITPATMVWWEGMAEWKALAETSLALATPPVVARTIPVPPPATTIPLSGGPQTTSGLAITSLVTGILGFLCSIILAPTAIITGHIARSQIKKNPNLKGGTAWPWSVSAWVISGLSFSYVMIPVLRSAWEIKVEAKV